MVRNGMNIAPVECKACGTQQQQLLERTTNYEPLGTNYNYWPPPTSFCTDDHLGSVGLLVWLQRQVSGNQGRKGALCRNGTQKSFAAMVAEEANKIRANCPTSGEDVVMNETHQTRSQLRLPREIGRHFETDGMRRHDFDSHTAVEDNDVQILLEGAAGAIKRDAAPAIAAHVQEAQQRGKRNRTSFSPRATSQGERPACRQRDRQRPSVCVACAVGGGSTTCARGRNVRQLREMDGGAA